MTTRVPETLITTGFSSMYSPKNRIINGDFRVWQRNTSFTDPDGVYTADMWKADMDIGGTGAGTLSRQAFTVGQTDVPGEPEYHLRYDLTTALSSNGPILIQPIEDVRTFAGSTVTVSLYAKVASGTKNITARLTQNFGAGGSSAVAMTDLTAPITTSWQRLSAKVAISSITGKTLGTDHYLEFSLRDDSVGDTYTLDVADVQVELGEHATAFERVPMQELMSSCQRYYHRVPASSLAVVGTYNTTEANFMGFFPTTMRGVPTPTLIDTTPTVDIGGTTVGSSSTITESTITDANGWRVRVDGFTGLTAGQAGFGYGSGSDLIDFDAEL